MAGSILRLTIDKGPKAGETLACNPGTVTRIGRVVTGNTIAVKDPGISQKHLNVFFLPEITRWVVTDLGSSNGTSINGSLIPPDEPFPISDGDVIKIGERTSISVNISDPRCDRPSKEVKDKDWEAKVDDTPKPGQRAKRRGRNGGRSTRFSRKEESVLVEPRVTRSLARGGSVRFFMKKLKKEDVMIMYDSEHANVMEKEKQSKENNAGVEEEVVDVDGENSSRVDNNAGVEEEVVAVDGENNSRVDNNARVEAAVLAVDGENNSSVEEVEDNMDNMTLGEWFDRMEEYLPKSINKVAEEIIDKLREKAQFFDEYISGTS